jgi:hypothetical protein
MSTPQLGITHIAAAQNQKEVTANAGFDALDNSDNAMISIANADANQTLSQAQLASAGCIKITGAITADRHVNLPAVSRSFIFQNATTGGHNLIVQVTGAPGATATIGAAAGLVEIFSDGTNVVTLTGGSGSAGTVTSVALSVPAEFSVSGSPVTGSGTLAVSKVSQSQNKVFASPDGSSGVATFRAVVEGDLSLSDVTTDNVSSTKHGFAPKSPADATQFMNGAGTPAFAQVKDSDLSTSDITTNNVSTSKHGFAPKAPNDATKFLDGTGAYSTPAGTAVVPNFADAETPSGTIDGSNAAFTLAHTPSPGGSLQLFKNGRVMMPAGVDYTLSAGTITYTSGSKPQTGDVHIAWYRY